MDDFCQSLPVSLFFADANIGESNRIKRVVNDSMVPCLLYNSSVGGWVGEESR